MKKLLITAAALLALSSATAPAIAAEARTAENQPSSVMVTMEVYTIAGQPSDDETVVKYIDRAAATDFGRAIRADQRLKEFRTASVTTLSGQTTPVEMQGPDGEFSGQFHAIAMPGYVTVSFSLITRDQAKTIYSQRNDVSLAADKAVILTGSDGQQKIVTVISATSFERAM